MQLTAIMCRAQQARQLTIAANAVLPNVRVIATTAAAAWAKEALGADKRDKRAAVRQQGAMELELVARKDSGFSENPDLGFADAGNVRL